MNRKRLAPPHKAAPPTRLLTGVLAALLTGLLLGASSAAADPVLPVPLLPESCSLALQPLEGLSLLAEGAAEIYQVSLTPSFPRTSIRIEASHLPAPSSIGPFDRYEGVAYAPDEISWRFPLAPAPEAEIPTWAGRIDEGSATRQQVRIEVRPYNSATNAAGPALLASSTEACR
ncbi:hypothetical protein J31TS4_15180 [Paenibacillus sp. J31TS4]|uniref:hypothetical protein n=1 Tax=Paenibacillus sp. J31TS4 TaxID=2807195 RepID=UPI001B2C1055|nr:hypothetical protein [Paenibacillus sp. J31TS4]GIP38238.1 hypothetical protein J31TS4_15180 [Paenibacillus sp. J31TS4]